MKKVFEQGDFSSYKKINLEMEKRAIYEFAQAETTVFISHKHSDLEDLKGVIGFLENQYKVRVYIDSRDSSMPITTSGETAKKIKDRIKKCDKFILLATNGAIDSKWCNWELGYGDAHKYESNIALFPMKPKGENDSSYKGNEYMSIYPFISYYEGNVSDRYSNGEPIPRGYYVRTKKDDGSVTITPLNRWLRK
jgi:hypothetical protein